jgi:hypothetical protein
MVRRLAPRRAVEHASAVQIILRKANFGKVAFDEPAKKKSDDGIESSTEYWIVKDTTGIVADNTIAVSELDEGIVLPSLFRPGVPSAGVSEFSSDGYSSAGSQSVTISISPSLKLVAGCTLSRTVRARTVTKFNVVIESALKKSDQQKIMRICLSVVS